VVFTSPGNSSTGFATTTATCNTGDTAISGQEVIIPLVRNFFPGSGGVGLLHSLIHQVIMLGPSKYMEIISDWEVR
jgi:hypothetical protein